MEDTDLENQSLDALEASRRSVNKTKRKKSETTETAPSSSTTADNVGKVAAEYAKSSGSSGSAATGVGAAVSTVNPVIGGALMAYGAVSSAAEADEKAKYDAKVDKLNRQQNALSQLSSVAQNFKRL